MTRVTVPWPLIRLGDVLDFKNGLNADKESYGMGVRFVNVLEAITYSHLRAEHVAGRVEANDAARLAFEVRRGDIVFNRTSENESELGLASVYEDDEPMVFGGFVVRGRLKTRALDPTYVGYGLRADHVRKQIVARGQGAIRSNIGQSDLREVRVPLPPINEQRAIAAALSDADALIAALDELITRKRAMKQGALQELLTGRTRLPGFTREWTPVRIGEVTECVAGGTPSTHVAAYWGGTIRWMSSGELHQKFVTEVEGRITEAGLSNSNARRLPVKSVLIGLAGQGKTRGTVAMNLVEVSTNQSIGAVLPCPSFCSEYLYYNLDSRYDELRTLSAGDGGRGGLNLAHLRSLEIPAPELREQQAIAAVLLNMDAEIGSLERRRDKMRAIKQGMMQALLTGRVRLTGVQSQGGASA